MAKSHKLKDGRYECQNCLGKFTKNEKTFIEPIFCKDSCRKEFWANGGMSLKKIETRVRQWTRDETQTAIDQLRAELVAMIPQPKRKKKAA